MFRSKRSNLVKRLWKCKLDRRDETSCSPEEVELKAAAQSFLKHLKDRQLEILVQAVESRGGERTECVPMPAGPLRLGRRTVLPQILCCELWRWGSEQLSAKSLKKMPVCATSVDNPCHVCCNPYHWSRVVIDPGPILTNDVAIHKSLLPPGVESTKEDISTETGGTAMCLLDGSSSTAGRYWCNVAYWEQRQRVGRLYAVLHDSVNIFQSLPHGDGMCLQVLQDPTNTDSIRRVRDKIGHGLSLSREGDEVWVYNNSDYPIFVNSPTLEIPNCLTPVVKKIAPGFSMQIFSYTLSKELERIRDPSLLDGPCDQNSIRVSFAKGWGPHYSRQFVTCCPCWIEILLRTNR